MRAAIYILGLTSIVGMASGQSVVVKKAGQAGTYTPYDGSYSRSSQVTFTGRIVGIGVSKPTPKMSNNVRFIVQTLGKKPKSYLVEAGPQWFVESQTTRPTLGQWVKVTGSKISDHGETKILAQQFQLHNHSVLALRRASGTPYWVDLAAPNEGEVPPDYYTSNPGHVAAQGTILQAKTFTVNGVQYAGYVVQTANGPANVIVQPPNFGPPTAPFNLGDNVRVFSPGYYPVVTTGGFVGSNQPANPFIVASSIYGPNGAVMVGPGVSYFPGYVPW
jgi:hypothetical protein